MRQDLTIDRGPYTGTQFAASADAFHGRVVGLRDVIDSHGKEPAGTANSLRLCLLGRFALCGRDGGDATPAARKVRALLACLALSPGAVWPREKLTALLWSDRGEEQARASLRVALAELRRALGEPSPVRTRSDAVSLDPAMISVDAVEFGRLAKVGRLEEAGALYRGDLLDGHGVRDPAFEDWLLVERTRLHDLAVDVLARLAESQAGDPAIETALRLLRLEPAREDTHRTLMRLYAATGRRAQALRQYQTCRETLQREMGVAPEAETERLLLEIQEDKPRPPSAMAPAPASAPLPTPARAPDKPSIAVLPFANMSGDPEQEYFSDGITEDIITDLSQVSALFVVARNSAFTLKGKAVTAQWAARELGVRHILEGSIRKSGRRVRISAQLIDGDTAGHLWAKRYDRDLEDIFAVQDEISRSIVDALRVKLLPEESKTIASRPTNSAEAHQRYLMARSFFVGGHDRRSYRVARQVYVEATEIDPRYARAWAGIANCDAYLLLYGDPSASFEGVLANSARALELSPGLAEAYASKGFALTIARQPDAARAAFEQALDLNPDLFEAHLFYGFNCQYEGLHEKAVALFERAAELHTNDIRSLGIAVSAYKSLGRHEAMLSAARRSLERIEAEVAVRPDNVGAMAFAAGILAILGEKARAEDWAARAVSIDPEDPIINYNVACAYAVLGITDAALDRLERAAWSQWARQCIAKWMRHDSDLDSLRSHPRFQAVVARLEAESSDQPVK